MHFAKKEKRKKEKKRKEKKKQIWVKNAPLGCKASFLHLNLDIKLPPHKAGATSPP